jgi:8-oxo-dGTP pyrophosphatase MutT (NUDIX family)
MRVRHAVRILLVDDERRVLLFAAADPETGAPFWFPLGGGIEAGEDVRAAAARELLEATGDWLVPDDLAARLRALAL